jgi:uncharacterized zinc-type alcohol dehydrogenase-like protein
MATVALAATEPKGKLAKVSIDLGPLCDEQVEIDVASCGICHSDLSMLDNAWGLSRYPLVPGHEVVGTIAALGPNAKGLTVGQRVGLGWFSGSCMSCRNCMHGDHNLCSRVEQTIVGRHGGFAQRVRSHWSWAVPLPDALDFTRSGPLFCGGITVFNPIIQLGIKPTDRVGVIGIGGLGHLALQFLNKWGCEVTAFTSSASKAAEAKHLGAHNTLSSTDDAQLAKIAGTLDFVVVTANVKLNWQAYIEALRPRGHLHFVGAVLEPLAIGAFPLMVGQKTVSGSPVGSPATIADMLEFCARHDINAVCETFPMSKANEAVDRLRSGEARYRVVLAQDLT